MSPDAPAAALAGAVAEAGGLGAFFAADTHVATAAPPPPWRPLRDPAEDPDVLRDRVTDVRARLAAAHAREPADVPVRVAASVTQMGLTARLVSPVLGVTLLTGQVPELTGAWWQPGLGGAFPLSLTGHAVPGPVPVADAISRRILHGPVRALAEATRGYSVSARVVWGNVASAVNGAMAMIARTRPDLAGPAGSLGERLLARAPLRGTGDRPGGVFRRRSCCLIYQAAPPGPARGVCGDCVLAGRDEPEQPHANTT